MALEPCSKAIKEDNDFKKYHYSFAIKKVLIIRSYSPLMRELIEYIKTEFPECVVDILQVKGAQPMDCYKDPVLGEIYHTESPKGFSFGELFRCRSFFESKHYDLVFVLYGMPNGLARFYNVELFAVAMNARYCVGYDTRKKIRVITGKRLFFKTIDYLFSVVIYFLNIIVTVFMLLFTLLVLIILSPLKLLFKLFKIFSRQR